MSLRRYCWPSRTWRNAWYEWSWWPSRSYWWKGCSWFPWNERTARWENVVSRLPWKPSLGFEVKVDLCSDISSITRFYFFFQEGTVTNSAIWLVLYAVRISLSLLMGMVTLTWVRDLLLTKPFKRKSFFSKQLFIGQESWKTKAFFSKQIFIAILKWRNSSLQRRFVYCICKARRVCAGGSEIIKKLIWEKEGKNCLVSLFNTSVKVFLLYGPPNRQITIFSSCIPTQNAKMGWWGFILDFPPTCR